jgi:hypothetical protein
LPLPEPHRKFVDFAKRNLSGLGMLVVANIIFMIAYQFALSVVMVPLIMLMML